jgi:predicted MPP superfamily phosphohydrolase
MFRFTLLLGVMFLLMTWYGFQGVKRLTADEPSARYRKTIHGIYWAFFIALVIGFAFAFYMRFSTDHTTPLMQWMINVFLTFFVTLLVFVLPLLLEDIGRWVVALVRLVSGGNKKQGEGKPTYLPGRRKFISQLAVVLAGIPYASFLYGIIKGKYDYRVHRQTLYFEELPEAFDGFTITQISDVHSGSFTDAEAVQKGIDKIKALGSDLFVFTGDLVNDIATEIEPYMEAFGQIRAPFGQYAILGNHDYGMYHDWPNEEAREANMERLKQNHARMGYRLLLDEHIALERGGEKISLLGVENWGRGFIEKGDLDKALTGVDRNTFKVLLSHDPSHWEEVVKQHPTPIHLTLSGHTHGMQFGIETPLFRWSPVRYRYKNWAGLAQEFGRMLYVNRGYGFIGFSGRVGIWPEITVLELRRGRA